MKKVADINDLHNAAESCFKAQKDLSESLHRLRKVILISAVTGREFRECLQEQLETEKQQRTVKI